LNAALGGITLPAVMLAVMEVRAAAKRREARALGLCEGRTVTVSPAGLSVRIPGARKTTMTAIGPENRAWGHIRRVTVNNDDLTIWMQPTLPDPEGRARVVVPLRVFPSRAEADAFVNATQYWHQAATDVRHA
jgi:hypothetical protein